MKTEIPIFEQSDEQILETVRQLQTAYRLKRTLRYRTERNHGEHSESVAEHVYALLFLSYYFLPLEDVAHNLDVEKVHRALLFHDFAEIAHGDIPYHEKTEKHELREREAAHGVFDKLPFPLRTTAHESWLEYEEQRSPEARFVYALDKIEPLFELFDPINEPSIKRLKFSYDAHIGKKLKATEGFPTMRKFVDVVTRDWLARDIFWTDKT